MLKHSLLGSLTLGVIMSFSATAEAGRIVWPCSGSVTSAYGPRSSPCSGCSTFHHGLDIGVGSGTYLGSPGNGTVTSYAYDSCGGNIFRIGYGNGWETRFLHCSASLRSVGTAVTRNVDVARSGNTGSCTTGAHLHFEVRRDGASQLVPGSPGNWVTRGNEVPQEYPGLNDPASSSDIPVVGDWNGDGIDTPGVYRSATFYLRNSNTAGVADLVVGFGNPGDVPVVGDWNGDGIDTVGVYRAGTWYLRNSNVSGGAEIVFAYGEVSDIPVPGDWDGNGTDTPGVFRSGTWYLRNSNSAGGHTIPAFAYGQGGDRPVCGDWDGNNTDTVGIFRAGTWYLKNSNSAGAHDGMFGFGQGGDIGLAGNWNSDPYDTIGVRRATTWYLRNSNSGGGHDIMFNYGN